MSKISIITINYNNLKGLKKTFKSVFKLSNYDFQFIVIDGGSNDGSKEYIELNSDKISYWVSEKDNGVYHAMNKGLKVATGEYCLFLNSGDYLYCSNVLSEVVKFLENKPSLAYGLIEWEDSKELWNPKRDLKDFEMAFHSLIPHQACFFKTDIIKELNGYKEEFKVISDWGMMIEILKKKLPIQKLDLVVSVCESQGISSKLQHLILQERILFLLRYSFKTLIKGVLFYFKTKLIKR